jgi:hypothetical protein
MPMEDVREQLSRVDRVERRDRRARRLFADHPGAGPGF